MMLQKKMLASILIGAYDLIHTEKHRGTYIIFLYILSFIDMTMSMKPCKNVFISLSP